MPTNTQEQDAVVDKSKEGKSFVIQARAGCGKSFILKAVARAQPRTTFAYAVFNTKNKDEINCDETKPNNLNPTTFHGLCNSYVKSKLKRPTFEGQKVSKIISKDSDFNTFDKGHSPAEKVIAKENYSEMLNLVSLMKNSMLDPQFYDVVNLANRYNISPPMERGEFCRRAIDFLKKSDEQLDVIDYDDMIRFFVLHNMHKDFEGDALLVDEAQDNTLIRTIIMSRLNDMGVQVIGVGDDRQAIYAFAGADSDSLSNIINMMRCDTMPLSVNFRCDKAIIRKAQGIVPDIQYHEDKPEGLVQTVNYHNFVKTFKPGDVAIGRFNRIIIGNCFRFIRDNKPATIQGKDFGNMLKNMIKSFRATSIQDFYARLETWYERQAEIAERNNQDVSDAVADRYECLKFLASSCNTVEEVDARIDKIFTDTNDDKMYKFSTAHKSKGLEWDNVYILDNDKFRNTNPKLPDHQKIQEWNLQYIAYTRARHNLNLIEQVKEEEVA